MNESLYLYVDNITFYHNEDKGHTKVWRYLPGASNSSRLQKGSVTTNSEAPESTSRMADGVSTRKQK